MVMSSERFYSLIYNPFVKTVKLADAYSIKDMQQVHSRLDCLAHWRHCSGHGRFWHGKDVRREDMGRASEPELVEGSLHAHVHGVGYGAPPAVVPGARHNGRVQQKSTCSAPCRL